MKCIGNYMFVFLPQALSVKVESTTTSSHLDVSPRDRGNNPCIRIVAPRVARCSTCTLGALQTTMRKMSHSMGNVDVANITNITK